MAVDGSLPHRGPAEQEDIRDAFMGVTTSGRVIDAFALPTALLE